MLVGRQFIESNLAMQERLQRHYGAAAAILNAPSVTVTDNSAASQSQQLASNPNWQAAFADAMARTGTLVEVQAAISEREAALLQRERMLAQREQEMRTAKPSADILPWRAMLLTTGR